MQIFGLLLVLALIVWVFSSLIGVFGAVVGTVIFFMIVK